MSRAKKEEFAVSTDTFLAHCARIARVDNGWMSAKDAHARGMVSSADAAVAAIKEGVSLTATDQESAQAARKLFVDKFEEARSKNRDSDFDQLLFMKLSVGVVDSRNYRIVAAAVGMWVKNQATQSNEAISPTSHYLGKVGDKVTVTVTVTHITQMNSQWGLTYIYNMQTQDGAQLSWFSSRGNMKTDTTYSVRGTIKDLREFRGQPQTVLTRCVAEQLIVTA